MNIILVHSEPIKRCHVFEAKPDFLSIELFNWGTVKVGDTHCDRFSSQFFIQSIERHSLKLLGATVGSVELGRGQFTQLDKLISQLRVVGKKGPLCLTGNSPGMLCTHCFKHFGLSWMIRTVPCGPDSE